MDYSTRVGHKTGSGAIATPQQIEALRQERLKRLALETINLGNDPYIKKNHVGKFECKLCLTLHPNEASYLTHTQCKKHQNNLRARAVKEIKQVDHVTNKQNAKSKVTKAVTKKLNVVPKFEIIKVKEYSTDRFGLKVVVDVPTSLEDFPPKFRILNSFEQTVVPENPKVCFLVISCPPYSNIGIMLPAASISRAPEELLSKYDSINKKYIVQILFNNNPIDFY